MLTRRALVSWSTMLLLASCSAVAHADTRDVAPAAAPAPAPPARGGSGGGVALVIGGGLGILGGVGLCISSSIASIDSGTPPPGAQTKEDAGMGLAAAGLVAVLAGSLLIAVQSDADTSRKVARFTPRASIFPASAHEAPPGVPRVTSVPVFTYSF
jgi:hypothetical protein